MVHTKLTLLQAQLASSLKPVERKDFKVPCIGSGSGAGKTTFLLRFMNDIKSMLLEKDLDCLKRELITIGVETSTDHLHELRALFQGGDTAAVCDTVFVQSHLAYKRLSCTRFFKVASQSCRHSCQCYGWCCLWAACLHVLMALGLGEILQ